MALSPAYLRSILAARLGYVYEKVKFILWFWRIIVCCMFVDSHTRFKPSRIRQATFHQAEDHLFQRIIAHLGCKTSATRWTRRQLFVTGSANWVSGVALQDATLKDIQAYRAYNRFAYIGGGGYDKSANRASGPVAEKRKSACFVHFFFREYPLYTGRANRYESTQKQVMSVRRMKHKKKTS